MSRVWKKVVVCFLALAMVLSICTAAKAQDTASDSGDSWINSMIPGSLPDKAPEAADDLYLHFNYDTIKEHQGEQFAAMEENADAVEAYLTDVINDKEKAEAKDDAYTDAEIEQLKIFYDQAADLDSLEKAGISELEPYLDMIQEAKTLEDLNKVLISDEFPFCPYLYLPVSAYDMSGKNNVFVYPDLLFVDDINGPQYYQDSKDATVKNANLQVLNASSVYIMADMTWLDITMGEAQQKLAALMDTEKTYAQDAFYRMRYNDQEYGAYGSAVENLSLEELAALCPNYPVEETMKKFGKEASPYYSVPEKQWLESFNSIWDEDNLETLKLLTSVKIIHECAPYLDAKKYDSVRIAVHQAPVDAETNAKAACNQNATFASLVAKIYVADHYSKEDVETITALAKDLKDVFHALIEDTSWLSDTSREKMIKKLDEMRFNILYPDGGYVDFSDLSLTETKDGGSLIGNYLKLKEFNNEKMNERIGGDAVSCFIWEYGKPSDADCFYDPDTNSMNILPGFTAAGIFESDAPEEVLLSGIGWLIAREISHGFDFYGSQTDEYGTGNCVLEEKDLSAYLEITDQLAAYYSTFAVLPGMPVNGNDKKVEAAADLSGMQLVLELAKEKKDFDYAMFYQNAANLYCTVLPSKESLMGYLSDANPLPYLRVNVNAQMFETFYDTFDVKEGDGMYLPEAKRLRFWGK